ncbi:hypothetical protein D9M72_530430 [compost metagenome]
MALVLAVSFSDEKMSPFFSCSSFSISSCLPSSSPARRISDTLYCSPSLMFKVRKMSFLSGVIDTWVDSIANSR